MEEEKRCSCADEGLRCLPLIRLRRERRRRRTAQLLAAGLLLLLGGVLTLLLTLRPCGSAPDSPTKPQSDSHPSGVAEKQTAEKPSVMLTGWTGNRVNQSYLLWHFGDGEGHIQGGFHYSNGSLFVPKKALYRVFLQISYNTDECSATDPLIVSNKVFVFRPSYPKDQLLLSAADTVACSHGAWKKSLFTSGLFKLETNDKLHVTSSHPNWILRNEHQVFFGAELVSG